MSLEIYKTAISILKDLLFYVGLGVLGSSLAVIFLQEFLEVFYY